MRVKAIPARSLNFTGISEPSSFSLTGKLFVRPKGSGAGGGGGGGGKAFFFLMIRARANVTKLASVIDKPRSYFRPEEHQIECVIKGGRSRDRGGWMPPATKKRWMFCEDENGKRSGIKFAFPLWQRQECVFVGEKSAEARCLLQSAHTHTHTHPHAHTQCCGFLCHMWIKGNRTGAVFPKET